MTIGEKYKYCPKCDSCWIETIEVCPRCGYASIEECIDDGYLDMLAESQIPDDDPHGVTAQNEWRRQEYGPLDDH